MAKKIASFILLAAVVFVIWLAYFRFGQANPGGNDFIPRWLGTRLLITEGTNPYSEETGLAIQKHIYGRQALPDEDQVLYAYPIYTSFVVGPFSLIGDYNLARSLWMTFLTILIVLTAIAGLKMARWTVSPGMLTLVLLFALLWYHSVRPIINGNPSIVVGALLAGTLLAIRERQDVIAGFLLAFSTIKPQMVVLLIPFVCLWAIRLKRWRLLGSFVISAALLVALGLLIEPGWIGQNLDQIVAYHGYTLPGTPALIFEEWLPSAALWVGLFFTLFTIILLLWVWRSALKDQSFSLFLIACFLTLAATNLSGIRTATANYIALLPALLWIFARVERIHPSYGKFSAGLVMVVLLVGLWWLFAVSRSGRMQNPLLFFPVPILVIASLVYSIRNSSFRETLKANP